MNWRRVKTFLILLLVGVNVFLIGSLWLPQYHAYQIEQEARETLIRLALQNGFEIKADLDTPIQALPVYQIYRSSPTEQQIAESLLGESYDESYPGGGIHVCENARGSVRFRNGGLFEAEIKSDPPSSQEALIDFVRPMLAGTGYAVDPDAAGNPQADAVRFTQTHEGYPVFNGYIDAAYSGGVLTIAGRWVVGDAETYRAEQNELTDTIFLLLQAVKDTDPAATVLLDIAPGLIVGAPRNDQCWLIPTLTCTFDTGTFFFDIQRQSLVVLDV